MDIGIFSNVIAGLVGFSGTLLLHSWLFLWIPCRDWYWALRSRVHQPVPLDPEERHVQAVRAAAPSSRGEQRHQELPVLLVRRLPGGSSGWPGKQPGSWSGENYSDYSGGLFLLSLPAPALSVLLQQPINICSSPSELQTGFIRGEKWWKKTVCQWEIGDWKVMQGALAVFSILTCKVKGVLQVALRV